MAPGAQAAAPQDPGPARTHPRALCAAGDTAVPGPRAGAGKEPWQEEGTAGVPLPGWEQAGGGRQRHQAKQPSTNEQQVLLRTRHGHTWGGGGQRFSRFPHSSSPHFPESERGAAPMPSTIPRLFGKGGREPGGWLLPRPPSRRPPCAHQAAGPVACPRYGAEMARSFSASWNPRAHAETRACTRAWCVWGADVCSSGLPTQGALASPELLLHPHPSEEPAFPGTCRKLQGPQVREAEAAWV